MGEEYANMNFIRLDFVENKVLEEYTIITGASLYKTDTNSRWLRLIYTTVHLRGGTTAVSSWGVLAQHICLPEERGLQAYHPGTLFTHPLYELYPR